MEKNKLQSLRSQLLVARQNSMRQFSNVEHRLEMVGTWDDVGWVNDSKATGLDATYYSLELMDRPIIWIVGSSESEMDYSVLNKLVKHKVKNIICFGEDETELKYSFANMVDGYAHRYSLREAVEKAKEWSVANDIILFSPATSNLGPYRDYKQRGEHFRSLVSK